MTNTKESETIPVHKTRARESSAANLVVLICGTHV